MRTIVNIETFGFADSEIKIMSKFPGVSKGKDGYYVQFTYLGDLSDFCNMFSLYVVITPDGKLTANRELCLLV